MSKEMQSKISLQRNEIARLQQVVQKLMKDKAELLRDLKWMRGEK